MTGPYIKKESMGIGTLRRYHRQVIEAKEEIKEVLEELKTTVVKVEPPKVEPPKIESPKVETAKTFNKAEYVKQKPAFVKPPLQQPRVKE